MVLSRGKAFVLCGVVLLLFLFSNKSSFRAYHQINGQPPTSLPFSDYKKEQSQWANIPQRFSVTSMKTVPTSIPNSIPRIQHDFGKETAAEKQVRIARLNAVKGNFTHAWNGYKDHAWLQDEVMPLSGGSQNPFGGWAATLVDSLDTLWIMGMHDDFHDAVEAINDIDFSTCALDQLNVFETTIRYLGGFLSANDLSEGKYPILIRKATEMGDMLYKAFDTPNRLPITRWNFKAALGGIAQEADDSVLVSEIGSLTLEFTRLSQVTGDPRYFDAVQRITDVFDEEQDKTKLPGMWPVVVNAKAGDFADYSGFTIGGMADSLYEYLPKASSLYIIRHLANTEKEHILLGGGTQQYRRLYEYAIVAIKRNIFYRPMTYNGEDIRLAGQVDSDGRTLVTELKTEAQAQHLGCFAGGMVGIAAKIFQNDEDLSLAIKLVEGCLWAYEVMPLGIMPEIMHTVPCDNPDDCPWDEPKWHKKVNEAYEGEDDVETKIRQNRLPPGVAKVDDRRYILRPEAIEAIFILHRITGDPSLCDRAWKMFNSIIRHTTTDIAHAGLDDCTVPNPPKSDRMESFWLAETLKYFYLIFSEPGVISLDEYVLNTEAHPLRRPS